MKNTSFFTLLLLFTLLFTAGAQADYIERSGWGNRYFKYHDKFHYFVGMDLQQLTSDTNINYRKMIDYLNQHDMNKVRGSEQ